MHEHIPVDGEDFKTLQDLWIRYGSCAIVDALSVMMLRYADVSKPTSSTPPNPYERLEAALASSDCTLSVSGGVITITNEDDQQIKIRLE